MEEKCDISVTVQETSWSNCWTGSDSIGTGLLDAHYHSCMDYVKTKGDRDRQAEFSKEIVINDRPAGLLTRLTGDGPVIKPETTDLTDHVIMDVTGWAPGASALKS